MFDFLKRKKKTRSFNEILTKENLDIFLKEVARSIDVNFSNQESAQLQILVRSELDNWFKNTIQKGKTLDATSVRVGICLGIFESLRKINEIEETEKVTYVS